MIAMAIFTVVVTIGIGSVLDAINQHHRTENMRTVMDNLNFMMEDMARNIRLGSNMHCGPDPVLDTMGNILRQNCPTGGYKLVFNDLNGTQVTYFISPTTNQVMKQEGTDSPQVITPTEVTMTFTDSGFTVRGAKTSTEEPTDISQPTVVIRLAGTISYKGIASQFAIQTAVAVRALDS